MAVRSVLTLLAAITTVAARGGEPTFNRDVRPILSDKCFFCHGPDTSKNKAKLRLDTVEGAYAALRSGEGHAIVPGKPDESLVLTRITSADENEVMPPPGSKLAAITAEEKATLRRWIERGAKYEPHWSFVPLPNAVPVPDVSDPKWPTTPLDRFVLAKLDAQRLKPSPPADPLRWLRRATLDLTGLPPTPEQTAAFEADLAANPKTAHETAVDGLLKSRAFGEQMAVPWLDAARYTDTFGYHSDSDFTPWPYRDWVVRAFNDDLPFDEFVTLQLAGDLLPNAGKEQVLPTAFNRLHRITNEGGSVYQEFFVDGVADRVHTVGTAFLGLTLECARCHDHKYDPITQKDYYGLFAFFNSINETGVYNHGNITPPPSLLLPTDKQRAALDAQRKTVRDLETKLATASAGTEARFRAWRDDPSHPTPLADQVGHFTFDEGAEPLRNRVTARSAADEKALAELAKEDKKKPKPDGKPKPAKLDKPQYVPGKHGTAAKLDGDRGVVFENFFLRDRWNPFTLALWVRDTVRDAKPVVLAQRCYGHDVGYNGLDLQLEDGRIEARVFRSWPDNGIGVRTVERVPKGEWAHVTFSYDGSGRPDGLKLYLGGKPLATTVTGDRLHKRVAVSTFQPGHFMVGAVFRGRGFKGGEVDDLQVFDRPLTPLEVRAVAGGEPLAGAVAAGDEAAVRAYYLSAVDDKYRRTAAELEAAREALVMLEDAVVEVPVMHELAEPRPAWVLARGAYDAPMTDKSRVGRDTPAMLLPFPKDAPRDRVGLARWLTQPDHPLTARVFVNRVWQQFFGRGLVATAENFGLQGEPPSHPELLDWLARDFVNEGWSVKRLCRRVVLSATYRQQTAATAEQFASDPTNKWLARGPSHRLPAESIRDLALAASGLLNGKFGGPPVRPYDPKHNGNPKPDQVHARSLYSYWRRTKPLPNMIALDRPSLEVCSVRRSRTNSPAQALVLLNDTQFVEAARVLATTCVTAESDPAVRIRAAWLRLTGTRPTAEEAGVLRELLDEQRAYFRADPGRADKLLAVGLVKPPAGVDAVEVAAFTVVCQAILNSDAAVWKR